jgi:CRISPR-associated protein Cmr6
MTPHMGDWYEKGGVIEAKNYAKALPADWHDPVPVGFLAVKEISLLFGVAVRSGLPDREKEQAESELETVFGYLKNALEWLGAGAKTAAGYGRFVEDGDFAKKLAREKAALEEAKQKAEQERQRQIELSKLGPLDRKIKETIDNRLDLNMKPITALIKALESGVFEEKKAAAEKIKSIMEAENAWKPTTASKKPEKDKDHQATLVVLKYL